jgi:hypothetical protein
MKTMKEEELAKDTDQIVSDLKKNGLFQMSLGSKELFHSNFLAWIFSYSEEDEHQKKFAVSFFEHLFKDRLVGKKIEKIKAPEREKMNIDLIFTIQLLGDETIEIIFENKVKRKENGLFYNQLFEYE